jgi:uncharacterized protein
MTVWGDADSLPQAVRDIVCRRVGIELERDPRLALKAVFVANRPIPIRASKGVSFVKVGSAEGEADGYIEERCLPGDMVLTRDIPLAERLIDSLSGKAVVINDRGDVFLPETIRERRSIRDAMRELALSGLVDRPGNGYGEREAKAFSRTFDREFSRLLKNIQGVRDGAQLSP